MKNNHSEIRIIQSLHFTVLLATVNVIDIKNKKEFTLRIGLIICPIYGVNSLVNTTGM